MPETISLEDRIFRYMASPTSNYSSSLSRRLSAIEQTLTNIQTTQKSLTNAQDIIPARLESLSTGRIGGNQRALNIQTPAPNGSKTAQANPRNQPPRDQDTSEVKITNPEELEEIQNQEFPDNGPGGIPLENP